VRFKPIFHTLYIKYINRASNDIYWCFVSFYDFKVIKDESGATAIEYGLIAALIGVAIVIGGRNLGNALNNKFQAVADGIDNTANNTTDAAFQ